jgi:hypothetical protein
LEVASSSLGFFRRTHSLERRISLGSSTSSKNEKIVVKRRLASWARNADFLGFDINTFGRGDDELESICLSSVELESGKIRKSRGNTGYCLNPSAMGRKRSSSDI